MDEKLTEEMAQVIHNTYLPIIRGSDIVGETCIHENEAYRLAEALVSAGYCKQLTSTWKLNNDGSGTCMHCHFTQRYVWDNDSFQSYCGVCGAKMIDIE